MANLTLCVMLMSMVAMVKCTGLPFANEYDYPLNFQCPANQMISRIYSRNDGYKKDRIFGFQCRALPGRGSACHCHWSGYLNGFDEPVSHMCGGNGVISGFSSYHDNSKEDRRWKVKCCRRSNYHVYNCYTTGWVNNWDQYWDEHIPAGQVLAGITSYHSNHYEDRRWKLHICSYSKGTRPCH